MQFYTGGSQIVGYNSATKEISFSFGFSNSFPTVPYSLIHDPLIHRILLCGASFDSNIIYHARVTGASACTVHSTRADAEANTNIISFATNPTPVKFLDYDIPDNFAAFYAQSTLPKIVFSPDPELTEGYNQIYTSSRIIITDAYLNNSGDISNQGIYKVPSYGLGVSPNPYNISIGNIDEVCVYSEGSYYSRVLTFAGVSGRIHFYAQNHQEYYSQYQSRIFTIDRVSGLTDYDVSTHVYFPFSLCYSVKKKQINQAANVVSWSHNNDSERNYWFKTPIFNIIAAGYNTTRTYSTTPPP